MRAIATDGVVCCSVCRPVTIVSSAKTAEPIEIPFQLWTLVGPRNHVLDEDAHWRHLANVVEPSVCGGDAAFLSNYFEHVFAVTFATSSSEMVVAVLVVVCDAGGGV